MVLGSVAVIDQELVDIIGRWLPAHAASVDDALADECPSFYRSSQSSVLVVNITFLQYYVNLRLPVVRTQFWLF